jgi:hypothetical protein
VDLLPDARFTAEIEQVIKRAKVAVVLWSERAIHSDYVVDEARLAKERCILMPARIDASQPPLGFRGLQTEDLSAWDGEPASPVIAGLVDAVARRAGKTPEPDASDAETADHLHGRDAEAKLWESIRTNPAPSVAEYRLYLERYPDGLFADLARLRVAALETDAAEAARRARRPAPMKLVAGATAVVGLVLALLLVPPRLDEARSVIGGWFPEATETEEPAFDPGPPAGDRELDTTGEDEVVEGDGDTPAPARPEDLAALATFTDTLADGSPCAFCPEMVVIPGGNYMMTSPPGEAYDDERPQHEVTVPSFCARAARGDVRAVRRLRLHLPAGGRVGTRPAAGDARVLGGCADLRGLAQRRDWRALPPAERGGVGVRGAGRHDDALRVWR